MTIYNLIVIIIIISYFINYYQNYQGPCLSHCYKKYNIIILIGVFLLGYYLCYKKLIIL